MIERDALIREIVNEPDSGRAKNLLELLNALQESERSRRQFWSNPLLIAISGGLLSILTGVVLGYFEHRTNAALERERLSHDLVRDAISSDPEVSAGNIRFLSEAGLLGDVGATIATAAQVYGPRRPAAPGETPPASGPPGLLLQVSNHSTQAAAQRVAGTLAPGWSPFILLRDGLWTVALPVATHAEGSALIEKLPDELRAAGAFIRATGDICGDTAPFDTTGPVEVRRCLPRATVVGAAE